jgi:2-polyprenyl-6-methoxyphenol hydroxylase-like FAD-dependent oxidoreductase
MKHWMMKTKSYIAGMSDTQGNVFLAECYGGEGGGDLCWFFAFPVTTTSATTSTKERIDDRDEILQMLYSRLQEGADDSWHSCVQQILQDTVQCNGPVLFRHLYDRTPEDVREWKVPQPWIPITLLGDAFHPVASYAMAGGGGNALADGMAVARELLSITNTNNLAEALRRYEGPVRERSITQAQKSQSNTTWIHSGWFGGYVAQFLFFLLTPVLWLLGKSP